VRGAKEKSTAVGELGCGKEICKSFLQRKKEKKRKEVADN